MSTPELEEELSYLRRSIADLGAEREAGDVSEEHYARLLERYEKRAAEVEGALGEEQKRTPRQVDTVQAGAPRRHRGLAPRSKKARLLTGWGAFSCFVLAALFLAMALADVGPFAVTAPLSVNTRVQIMLAEASVLGSNGEIGKALSTYGKVLALRPLQPVALADGGWLARLTGISDGRPSLVRRGDADIEAAVEADPSWAVAHAYDGVLLYEDRGEARQAVVQFDTMLDDRPSDALLYSVKLPAAAAYKAANKPVPGPIAAARRPRATSSS